MEISKNVTVVGNHTIGDGHPSRRNETDGDGNRGLTNETLRDIKTELINRTIESAIELIENFTLGRGRGSRENAGRNDRVDDESVVGVSAVWAIDIAKAFDRMDKKGRGLPESERDIPYSALLDIMHTTDSLSGSALALPPMLPAVEIETGKILVDLRGMDPVVTAVDTLWKMEVKENVGSFHRERRDINYEVESSADAGIPGGPEYNDVEDQEEELILNITSILDALEAATK